MSQNSNEKMQQLLRATANGDAPAFQALYNETAARLNAVAIAIVGSSGLAEDVLQDAYVQIWHRASDFHADRGSVLTWMTTIVRYRAIDLLRKRGHGGASGRQPPIDVDPDDIDFLQHSETNEDDRSRSGPLARAIANEENSMLRKCVDRLSSNQQRCIALAFFRGFTHQELAECLAEPLGTIKSRLRRGMVRLKDCLENIGEGHEVQRRTS